MHMKRRFGWLAARFAEQERKCSNVGRGQVLRGEESNTVQ